MKTYQKSLYITKTRNGLIDEIADQGYIVLMIFQAVEIASSQHSVIL